MVTINTQRDLFCVRINGYTEFACGRLKTLKSDRKEKLYEIRKKDTGIYTFVLNDRYDAASGY